MVDIIGYISLAIVVMLLIAALIGRRLEIRARPHCPVHDKPMDLWGDMEYEEYTCGVKGCTWCANVYEDGETKIFKT
jgi:hypothetical protein